MLLHGKEEYRTNHCFIGVTPVEKINKLESPRILASHLPYAWLPTQLRNNKDIKIINVCRNPKDTCVSFFHYTKKCAKEMYDGEWSGFLDIFMRGDSKSKSFLFYFGEKLQPFFIKICDLKRVLVRKCMFEHSG